jgi:hypothetical protein
MVESGIKHHKPNLYYDIWELSKKTYLYNRYACFRIRLLLIVILVSICNMNYIIFNNKIMSTLTLRLKRKKIHIVQLFGFNMFYKDVEGQSKLDNQEKLATRRRKTNKNTTLDPIKYKYKCSINKTLFLLQTTRGKDEPNIVFMRKS